MRDQRLLGRIAGVVARGKGHYSPYLAPSAALVRQLFALGIQTCVGDFDPRALTLRLRNGSGRHGPKGYVLTDCLKATRVQFSILRLTGAHMPKTIFGLYEGTVEGNSIVFRLALPPVNRERESRISLPSLEQRMADIDQRMNEIRDEVRMLLSLSTGAQSGEG